MTGARSWSQRLYDLLGETYQGQGYLLGYRPQGRGRVEVGLNHLVGPKLPAKRWPEESWLALAERLRRDQGLAVAWQEGQDDLVRYMEWLASCEVVVTNDSLGLHLALALSRKVVALFGPTWPGDLDWPPQAVALTPNLALDCRPCYSPVCRRESPCLAAIGVAEVQAAVASLLGRR